MKIDINVLPEGEKEKIIEEKKIGFAMKLVFGFVATLILVNIVLYLMQIVLQIEYKAAKRASESSMANNSGKEIQLEKMFRDTGAQVAKISKITSLLPNWARVLARVSELSPDGVRINQLSADGSQLKLSGFSKTRDDFLVFQNQLKAEGFQFSNNISNLVASNDFKFDMEVTVPQDYLTRK